MTNGIDRTNATALCRRYEARVPRRARKLDVKEALARYLAGASDPEIAEECGVHKRTVGYWRQTRGLPPNRERGGRAGVRRLSPSQRTELLKLRRDGAGINWLARKFDVSRADIGWHCRSPQPRGI